MPKPVHKPEKEAPKNAYLCAFSDGESECESWDDDDDFNISTDDDEWKLIDGVLVSDDDDNDGKRSVYMKRVDN